MIGDSSMSIMDRYFDALQRKYNYDQKMMTILKYIVAALMSYYGEEKVNDILENVFNVEIHVRQAGEDPNEYISNSIGIKDEYIKNENVDGHVTTRPVIKDGKVTSKSIIYLINDLDLNNPMTWSTLVHELCHHVTACKDFEDHREINRTFRKRNGFQIDTYDLNGSLIDTQFSAIEETVVSYEEMQVMNKLLHRNDYSLSSGEYVSGYILAVQYFQYLIDYMKNIDNNFLEKLKTGRIEYLESLFAPFGFCYLNSFFEKCIQAVHVHDSEKLDKIITEIEGAYEVMIRSLDTLSINYTYMSKKENIDNNRLEETKVNR